MNLIETLLSKVGYRKVQKKSIGRPSTYSINMSTTIYPAYSIFRDYDAYSGIDEVYSVISFLAETAASIPFYGYEIKSDTAMKGYVKKSSTSIEGKLFRTKAMEDLPEQDKLSEFLKTLSYEQKVLIYTHLFLLGEVFLYKEVMDVGINAGTVKLHILNPQNVTVVITESFPQTVKRYDYKQADFDGYFDPEEIIHIKYPNPTYVNGANWRGLSPLAVLSKRLNRMQANMDTSVAQIQNGGVPGIVWEKDISDVDILNRRKNQYATYASNPENKGAPYFADGELGYIPLGINIADMGLVELAKIDFTSVCNVFKVPEQLLNNHSASTDNNMEWAEKRMYTNSIIPNVIRLRDGLISGVIPEIKDGKKRYIEEDLSGVKVLHEDLQKQVQSLSAAWYLKPNQKLEAMGYPVSEDPLMDEYIIPSGMMLLSDLAVPPDVNVTDGENQPANSR